jgi:AraC-like DNA-binding protein
MEYLTAWRLALAKDLLRRQELSIGAIARQVGYRSASAFSVAFMRSIGVSPKAYARKVVADLPGIAAQTFEGAIA